MQYTALVLGTLAPLLIIWAIGRALARPSRPAINFPPGPPTVPFLGNLHQIPLVKPFVRFAELGRQHGAHGLLGLRVGPRGRAVVLNSWRSVRDLLDQRGAVYSSRPPIPLVGYVVPSPPGGARDLHLVFMPYGPQWRRARRTVTEFLRGGGAGAGDEDDVDLGGGGEDNARLLRPLQHAESSQMMWEVLQAPARYDEHVLRCFGAVVLASVFGVRGRDYAEGAPLRRFFAVQHEWAGMLDNGSVPPIDVFPFLRYVPDVLTPWRGWRQRAASLKARQSSLYSELFQEAKARVEAGKSQDCFIAGLLRDQEKDDYTTLELEYISGFLLEGGSDTTAETFQVFILAMAAHPEIQKKAQAEVDRVFGSEGVQNPYINMEELPYLQACLLEVSSGASTIIYLPSVADGNQLVRWRPVFPLAIPHATTQDDQYQGYTIPKGTTVFMNVWAVNHDPDEYDEPDTFRPERFLEHPLGIKTVGRGDAELSVDHRRAAYGFGAGRRVCAGQRMAESSMMLTMSKLLWCFDIVAERELDTGVHTAFKDAILTGPKHIPVNFKVRGEDRRAVIEQDWKRADEFLKRYE